VTGGGRETTADAVAVEHYLTVRVARETGDAAGEAAGPVTVATLACTPEHLEELTVGFLVGQGLLPAGLDRRAGVSARREAGLDALGYRFELSSDRRVATLTLNGPVASAGGAPGGDVPAGGAGSGVSRFVASGCGQAVVFNQTRLLMELPRLTWAGHVPVASLLSLTAALQDAPIFRLTGGTHSALAGEVAGDGWPAGAVVVRREDIGRHNAVDKVVGHLWLAGKLPAQAPGEGGASGDRPLVLATSGRISSDIVLKAARAGFPVVVSHGAPTVMAVEIGRELGLTVAGFARGRRLNLYSHPERVTVIP